MSSSLSYSPSLSGGPSSDKARQTVRYVDTFMGVPGAGTFVGVVGLFVTIDLLITDIFGFLGNAFIGRPQKVPVNLFNIIVVKPFMLLHITLSMIPIVGYLYNKVMHSLFDQTPFELALMHEVMQWKEFAEYCSGNRV